MGATIDTGTGAPAAEPAGNPDITGRKVVTRFAPSPTGYLHLGGARTALFNWLHARHHGGTFLLRIEDTDRARSTQQAIDAILEGMHWLGLDPDEAPTYQFARAERHAAVAHAMVAHGHAYRCYLTPDELAAMRADAQAAKKPLRVRSPWRDAGTQAADGPFVVRLKAPQDGETTIDDQVQGTVTVQNAELDDLVLLRSDGTPTYMLAVVVDDHDMGVTHVIRGDDHLNNAFRQLPIIRAMDAIETQEGSGGWPDPVYAHIPLIHGSDGAKLSKRHGAVGIEAYRDEMGILPEALDNYLLRLGWGHGDDEIISRDDAVRWFDLAGVGKSPSRFDLKKLENLNGHYIREAGDARLAALVVGIGGYPDAALLERAMPSLKPRAANLNELSDSAIFLFATRPLVPDEGAAALLTADARIILVAAHAALDAVHNWDTEALEAAVRRVAEDRAVKLGQVAQPLRAALTGRKTSPGIFDVLALLGREESLGRIADAMRAI
ncbi:glutamate--tRNA ligase [uncultured Sphingomonas sp.]|uniref:glutamate--tRNA ligase n=1 Tax=uncultured Sphingomonas sp. TaxID=158754 RepID=UPI0035CC2817